ncbi:TIGR04255 family protein [Aetokthonos hydrillicola]|uniref:TIGR04255 family protein n=1 Tax=Aetokthonos hydrillicola TaxID=1550245 RepID=UPI001FBBE36A|nr:TIGR04255 family protein [Aetokthonos hydrillicola]
MINLPESKRVIYKHNPLIEVVCQLRFPPILKISHQEPVEFQDEIRFQYPLFEITQPQVPIEIAKIIQQLGVSLPSDLSYDFKSEDNKWQLTITQDFIALTTSVYERYEYFKKRLKEAVEIFEKIYKPSFYTRVGLRYKDLIIRSKLGLKDKDWSDLIESHIASELHNPEISSSIQAITKNLILKIESGQVHLNHGLVTVKGLENNDEELAYLLDADFYTEQKIERNGDVWEILDHFNKSAGKFFRWSITDTLREAMEPQEIDDAEV